MESDDGAVGVAASDPDFTGLLVHESGVLGVFGVTSGEAPGLNNNLDGDPGIQAATLLHTTPDTNASLHRTLAATPCGQSATRPTASSVLDTR